MSNRDIIVVGGSAGSNMILRTLVSALPRDFAASLFIVTHIPATGARHLVGMLQAQSTLPVREAADRMPIRPGEIVVAARNHHLVVTPEGVRLGAGPRENMARPAIDPLFRSAALTFGGRVVGVVLSGMLGDGAAGLAAIKDCGGMAVVQDPDDAEQPEMPRSALRAVEADRVVAAAELPRLLIALARDAAGEALPPPAGLALEVEIALGGRLGSQRLREIAEPVPLTCPNCDGVLSEVKGPGPLRFRCQTGHAVTADDLFRLQAEQIEEALRVALRVVEERLELVTRMGEEARAAGRSAVAELYEQRIDEFRRYAETLRKAAIAAVEADSA